MTFFKQLHIQNRFFTYITILSAVFLLSYWIAILLVVAWFLTCVFATIACIDLLLLFRFKNGLVANRVLPQKFSNSDENKISITIHNNYPFAIQSTIIDELPAQFQKRDFTYTKNLEKHTNDTFEYTVTPFNRGEYHFGGLNIYVATAVSIFSRRYHFDGDKMVAVQKLER